MLQPPKGKGDTHVYPPLPPTPHDLWDHGLPTLPFLPPPTPLLCPPPLTYLHDPGVDHRAPPLPPPTSMILGSTALRMRAVLSLLISIICSSSFFSPPPSPPSPLAARASALHAHSRVSHHSPPSMLTARAPAMLAARAPAMQAGLSLGLGLGLGLGFRV